MRSHLKVTISVRRGSTTSTVALATPDEPLFAGYAPAGFPSPLTAPQLALHLGRVLRTVLTRLRIPVSLSTQA
jgi:hypothetical protein